MATNETAFRTELVNALRGTAFVQVISQRFMAGMPDLLVCWSGDVWFLELKYKGKLGQTLPLINLSDLQRSWMRRFQKAGGHMAWVVGVGLDKSEWRLYAGTDPDQTRVTDADFAASRTRGKPWGLSYFHGYLVNRL